MSQLSPDVGSFWKRVSPVSNSSTSPGQPHSLREALAQAQSAGRGGGRALRESLHPMLRQKLVSQLLYKRAIHLHEIVGQHLYFLDFGVTVSDCCCYFVTFPGTVGGKSECLSGVASP